MCKELKVIKVEADFSADPLWCKKCFTNLDLEDFLLPAPLVKELYAWIADYGTWIDWEEDGTVAGAMALEAQHNERGERLTEQLKEAFTDQYEVVFSPSIFTKGVV